jgi:hypothetical protein
MSVGIGRERQGVASRSSPLPVDATAGLARRPKQGRETTVIPNAPRIYTPASIESIRHRIHDVEKELSREAHAQQRRWHYPIHRRRIWFDREVRRAHQQLRQSIPSFIRHGSLRNLLTAPVVYSLIVPLALLDLWVTVYQWICFPIFRVALVRRRRYFILDRHTLNYLNAIEKINCSYCSYANGVLAYVREVAARTEQYWCPIKHARALRSPHSRYHLFFDFGDAERYRRDLAVTRRALRDRRRLAQRQRSRVP